MFQATAARLRAAESFRQRLLAAMLAGLAAACAFAAIATSLYMTPQARVMALGIYSVFGTGAGFACAVIRRLLDPSPALRSDVGAVQAAAHPAASEPAAADPAAAPAAPVSAPTAAVQAEEHREEAVLA